MIKVLGIAFLFVSQLMVEQAYAEMIETRELLSWCADGSSAGTAACTAYIMGISDAVTEPSAASCSSRASRSQIREAVVRHIMSLQAQAALDFPAALPVTLALRQTFPCPQGK